MPRICSAAAFPMLQQPEFKSVRSGVRACLLLPESATLFGGMVFYDDSWMLAIFIKPWIYGADPIVSAQRSWTSSGRQSWRGAADSLSGVGKLVEKNAERPDALERYRGRRLYQLE
jgi:hypothetical protein